MSVYADLLQRLPGGQMQVQATVVHPPQTAATLANTVTPAVVGATVLAIWPVVPTEKFQRMSNRSIPTPSLVRLLDIGCSSWRSSPFSSGDGYSTAAHGLPPSESDCLKLTYSDDETNQPYTETGPGWRISLSIILTNPTNKVVAIAVLEEADTHVPSCELLLKALRNGELMSENF